MGDKEKILEYRERLDKTLASHNFTDGESIKSHVRNQLLHSSPSEIQGYVENLVEKKAKEVVNFLDMLRSVGNDKLVPKTNGMAHGDWKLKQDSDEYRVMYREGPQGTPFHTLLVEGYVDGPVDVCLCLSLETNLFSKWWPQFSFPSFKILDATPRHDNQKNLLSLRVAKGCIKSLCDLVCLDPRIITVCLGIESILRVGEIDKELRKNGELTFMRK